MNLPLLDQPPWNHSCPPPVPSPLPSDGRGEGQGEVRVFVGCEKKFFPHMVGTPRRGVRASRRDAPTKEEFCLTPVFVKVGNRNLPICRRGPIL
jgi:hypothetical protein